jgi:hypothetical protein
MDWLCSCFPCLRSQDPSSNSYHTFSSDDDTSISPKYSQQISLSLSNSLPPLPPIVVPKDIEIGEIHHSREPECVICLGEFSEVIIIE